jgi:hypothetical protein
MSLGIVQAGTGAKIVALLAQAVFLLREPSTLYYRLIGGWDESSPLNPAC